MVVIKISILVMFIVLAFTAFNADNIKPFAPEGTSGIVSAASLIFFAYIGFDAISTSGEETKNPQKHLPIAIIGSLFVATVLYILVALAATGAIPYKELDGSEAPLADALSKGAGFTWGATVLSIGALIAITSVVLTVLYGQTRIMFAMSRDGLVPRWLAYVSPKTRTPVYTTAGFALLIALLAAVVPLAEIAKLVNIGTLFAFLLVNIGVMVLRRTKPDLERGFRVPAVWICAPIGCFLCLYLMIDLPATTWERFVGWLVLGLLIYFFYGRKHSRLRRGEVVNPEAQYDEGRDCEDRRDELRAVREAVPARVHNVESGALAAARSTFYDIGAERRAARPEPPRSRRSAVRRGNNADTSQREPERSALGAAYDHNVDRAGRRRRDCRR